jgi:hypothetical protein
MSDASSRRNNYRCEAVLVVGGLRATTISQFVGVAMAEATRASRDEAKPIISGTRITEWGTREAGLLLSEDLDVLQKWEVSQSLHMCGVENSELLVALSRKGPMNASMLEAWTTDHSEARIIMATFALDCNEGTVEFLSFDAPRPEAVTLDEDILIVDYTAVFSRGPSLHANPLMEWPVVLTDDFPEDEELRKRMGFWSFIRRRLPGLAIDSLARGWSIEPGDLFDHLVMHFDDVEPVRVGLGADGTEIKTGLLCTMSR